MRKLTLSIGGMECTACVSHVTEALSALPGTAINGINVGTADLTIDEDQISVDQVLAAIHEAGYSGRISEAPEGSDHS